MFFDWKIQLEKVQLTRDLNDDNIIYQGINFLCKNDQGCCDPTTRTQAKIVWFPEDTCTTFQVAKTHAKMIKFHQNYSFESIPYEDVNPDKIRQSNYKFRNIHNIENKLTRFQVYPETELACEYNKPLSKTQNLEILVEYDQVFDLNTGRLIIHPHATHYSTSDENSYIPVNLLRTQETLVEKKTTRQRQYTFTRSITNEQHSLWRNSL